MKKEKKESYTWKAWKGDTTDVSMQKCWTYSTKLSQLLLNVLRDVHIPANCKSLLLLHMVDFLA